MNKIVILTQPKYADIARNFKHLLGDSTTVLFHHNELKQGDKYDLAISLLYNRIIKNGEFDIPRLGTINIHPSLLPSHRGSCPNFWAVLSGDGAGWTAHKMTEEIDRGPIYLQKEIKVKTTDTGGALWERLFEELPEFLRTLAQKILDNDLVPLFVEQNNEQVNTLKEFHAAHDFHEGVVSGAAQRDWMAAYAMLSLIQACTYPGYNGFVLKTQDGDIEFIARKI